VGELDVDGYACLGSDWLLNCPIVLATREHRPRDPCQLVGRGDDQDVSRCPHLKRGHPCTHRDSVSLRSQHHSACPVNQDLTQVVVTALADPVEFCLTTGRVLLRRIRLIRRDLPVPFPRCTISAKYNSAAASMLMGSGALGTSTPRAFWLSSSSRRRAFLLAISQDRVLADLLLSPQRSQRGHLQRLYWPDPFTVLL
jgi:hypothetical protein